MRNHSIVLFFLGSVLIACGPSAQVGADGSVTDDPCQPDETRCVGQSYQTCVDGFFTEQESCAASLVCDPGLGCAECRPNRPTTCVGDNVHTCNSDGTVGDMVEMCEFESCSNGNCGEDDCASGAELIYVVDDSNNLYSYDPSLLPGDGFQQIGVLNCPNPGNALEGFDPAQGPATPFSMSVDRNAQAWVLYSSGKVFHVSTEDASCQATSFQVGQNGFDLFGMGFVSDTAGGSEETLFIAGGAAGSQMGGTTDLGSIDTGTMTVGQIGTLPSSEYSPELTGTGDAELFGYYPGANGFVAQIDKASAQNTQSWNLPSITDQVRAWAFAHWGGDFYIFITTTDLLGTNEYARVLKLDPDTGNTTTAQDDTGRIIVGAGVSTCAPVVVN